MPTRHVTTAFPPIVDVPRRMMSRSAGEMTFDPRIPAELAARLKDPQEVLQEYGYTGKNAFNLIASPLFQNELKRCIDETVNGLTFQQRAKLMAPDILEHAYDLATDRELSPAIRLDAQKWIAKMADLEPKEDKASLNQAFQLILNLAPK